MFDRADADTLNQGYPAATFLYGNRADLGIEDMAPRLSGLTADLIREIGTHEGHGPAPALAKHGAGATSGTDKLPRGALHVAPRG